MIAGAPFLELLFALFLAVGNCPMINVPGLTFPVKEHFLEDIIELIR